MDIKDMSVIELKALAFDERGKIDMAQNNISVILQELQSRQKVPVEVKKNEPKTV